MHYSFIYLLFKNFRTKYRRGRAYVYQTYVSSAHQNMAALSSFTTLLITKIVAASEMGAEVNFLF